MAEKLLKKCRVSEILNNTKLFNEWIKCLESEFNEIKTPMSVTRRTRLVMQPYGRYVNKADFKTICMGLGEEELCEEINVHPSLIGMAVDYLTRFILTKELEESFSISLRGAIILGEREEAIELLKDIKGLDDKSIYNAIKITGFDVVYRKGTLDYVPIETINPNNASVKNVRLLVERTVNFFKKYGPIISYNVDFKGAYTNRVICGDCDFITSDTLWDLKVLKKEINREHILQILMYWRMGLRSNPKIFNKIKNIGIYNPRKNKVYLYSLKELNPTIIKIIDKYVIGY